MTKYFHRASGKTLEVHESFSGWWIVGSRKPSGSFQRFKSQTLPPCVDEKTCQSNLDAYAKREHLSVAVPGRDPLSARPRLHWTRVGQFDSGDHDPAG